MKIAIYGTGNYALRFIRRLVDTKRRTRIMGIEYWDCEIVYFVESFPTEKSFYGKKIIQANQIKWNDFDYLIVAIRQYEEITEYLKSNVSHYEDNKDKIVHSLKFASNMQQDAKASPYTSCNVIGDLSFLFDTMDITIGEDMLTTRHTYSESLIQAFFDLAQQYYGDMGTNEKIFFDIGANIGTTSIYVKKIIAPTLRVIGIEAGKKNYDLFRANCILNDVEDIEAANIAFSNNNDSMKYIYINTNPGGSYIADMCDQNGEEILTETIDSFVQRRNIDSKEIGFIWMDTEGAESEIIEGGMSTLSVKKIPLMQEYNPMIYKNKGTYDGYIKNIKKLYSNFIDVSYYLTSGLKIIKNVNELDNYTEKMQREGRDQIDVFFF
ncbi:MAG: FkbM family methyltransferase [Dorea sp.]|nr:FkbM family methyltransferase [Dorea sp.]